MQESVVGESFSSSSQGCQWGLRGKKDDASDGTGRRGSGFVFKLSTIKEFGKMGYLNAIKKKREILIQNGQIWGFPRTVASPAVIAWWDGMVTYCAIRRPSGHCSGGWGTGCLSPPSANREPQTHPRLVPCYTTNALTVLAAHDEWLQRALVARDQWLALCTPVVLLIHRTNIHVPPKNRRHPSSTTA